MGTEALPTAVGAGVFGMLVALFTLFMRSMADVGKRADSRADAELERTRADLAAMTKSRDEWQAKYLEARDAAADPPATGGPPHGKRPR